MKKDLPKATSRNLKPGSAKQKNSIASFSKSNWFQLAIILVGIIIVYSPIIKKEFTNYDDDWYILNNPFIHPFSLKGLGKIFFSSYAGQYSPLPTVFLGILSVISGSDPALYNIAALLLHLINTSLVCWLVFRLSKNSLSSLVIALLFGICSVNVEAVAWASAVFKIGFYALFFLASLIAYTYYLSTDKLKYFLLSLALCVFSVLSKEQAVALVISLVCIDFLNQRNLLSRKVILEKLPFLAVSLLFGIVTLNASKSGDSEFIYSDFSLLERIMYACYALGEYAIKSIMPYKLAAHYPYPHPKEFSLWFYLHPVIVASLVYLYIRNINTNRKIAFGILFFFTNVAFTLVLQIVAVRLSVMSDRYSYIPSIGIYYVFIEGLGLLRNKARNYSPVIILSVFILFFSVRTYMQCGIWHDSITLWNNVIEQNQTIPFAYSNRGNMLAKEKRYTEALNDFNKAIQLDPNFANAYYNRGIVFMDGKKYDAAIADYSKAIELKPRLTDAYNNRANVFMRQENYKSAFKDYNKIIEINPAFTEAYGNRGWIFLNENKFEEALRDFNKAIELKPDYFRAYNNRGTLFLSQKKYEEAIADFSKTIELSPGHAKAFYYRGMAEFPLGKIEVACNDLKQAASLGYNPPGDSLLLKCK